IMSGEHIQLFIAVQYAHSLWFDCHLGKDMQKRIVFFAGGFGDSYMNKRLFFDTLIRFADNDGNCNICHVPPESSVCQALYRSQIFIPRVGGGSGSAQSSSFSSLPQHDKNKAIVVYVKAPPSDADDRRTDCPFCQTVLLILEEKNILYDREFINLRKKPKWFFKVNPHGILPLIKFSDGRYVSNSDVILGMIEEMYPDRPLVAPPYLACLGVKIIPKIAGYLKSEDKNDYGLLLESQIFIPRVGGGSGSAQSSSFSSLPQHDKNKAIVVYVKAPPSDTDDRRTDCPFCQTVLLILEEKNILYDREFINLRKKPKWFFKVNPHGILPLIKFSDGGITRRSFHIDDNCLVLIMLFDLPSFRKTKPSIEDVEEGWCKRILLMNETLMKHVSSCVNFNETLMNFDDGDDPTVEQVKRRAKWDNGDYVCKDLIFNDFKHTLKHKKEELTLVELGSHLRIDESLCVKDSDKLKGNNVAGPSVVNMVKHNNSSRMMMLRGNESKTLVHERGYVDLRLGHVHFKRIQDMLKDGLIPAFNMDTESEDEVVNFLMVNFFEKVLSRSMNKEKPPRDLSRAGPVQWLNPYTDEVLVELSKCGVKSFLAVPVSFVSEHIETLEEIDMKYKELAFESGAENWGRVIALRCTSTFITDLAYAVIKALPSATAMTPSTSKIKEHSLQYTEVGNFITFYGLDLSYLFVNNGDVVKNMFRLVIWGSSNNNVVYIDSKKIAQALVFMHLSRILKHGISFRKHLRYQVISASLRILFQLCFHFS
nr:dehydroascorbate reductase 2 [Tanacetum cinerariifolium]